MGEIPSEIAIAATLDEQDRQIAFGFAYATMVDEGEFEEHLQTVHTSMYDGIANTRNSQTQVERLRRIATMYTMAGLTFMAACNYAEENDLRGSDQ